MPNLLTLHLTYIPLLDLWLIALVMQAGTSNTARLRLALLQVHSLHYFRN